MKVETSETPDDTQAKVPAVVNSVRQLSDLMVKTVHGTIGFTNNGMILGFYVPTHGDDGAANIPVFITSDNGLFRCEIGNKTVKIGGHNHTISDRSIQPLLDDRWGTQNVKTFLDNPTYHEDFYKNIKKTFEKYLYMPAQAQYGILALWSIATYFAQEFSAFPFIFLLGPKESGKSQALEIISYISFNALKTKSITESALGDYADGMRGTILFDQAERLQPKMIGILADSYKQAGGKRLITEGKNANRTVREFSAYCPKGFAATMCLDRDLMDRCAQFTTVKTTKHLPDIVGDESIWWAIRDSCYRFLLCKHQEVKTAYGSIHSNGTRRGELWRPLAAVAQVIGLPEAELTEIKNAFDICVSKTKAQLSAIESGIFQVLQDRAAGEISNFEMTNNDILCKLALILPKLEIPTPQQIGQILSLFSLVTEGGKKQKTRRKETYYTFSPDHVMTITRMYMDD
ncbi:MAG: hypothetical protein WCJ03_10290 [Bacteroidales bacterium]